MKGEAVRCQLRSQRFWNDQNNDCYQVPSDNSNASGLPWTASRVILTDKLLMPNVALDNNLRFKAWSTNQASSQMTFIYNESTGIVQIGSKLRHKHRWHAELHRNKFSHCIMCGKTLNKVCYTRDLGRGRISLLYLLCEKTLKYVVIWHHVKGIFSEACNILLLRRH